MGPNDNLEQLYSRLVGHRHTIEGMWNIVNFDFASLYNDIQVTPAYDKNAIKFIVKFLSSDGITVGQNPSFRIKFMNHGEIVLGIHHDNDLSITNGVYQFFLLNKQMEKYEVKRHFIYVLRNLFSLEVNDIQV